MYDLNVLFEEYNQYVHNIAINNYNLVSVFDPANSSRNWQDANPSAYILGGATVCV